MSSENTASSSTRLQIILSPRPCSSLCFSIVSANSPPTVSGGLRCTRSGKSPYWRWKFTGSAVFVVTHPVSLIQNSVSSIDRRRMNLTPQRGGPGEFGHDTVHLVVNLIFHSFPLCRKREPPKCRNLLNQFSTTACKAIKIMPLKQSSQVQQLVQLTVFIAEL